jgi:hypothetical protein
MGAQVGDRVGAVSHTDDTTVYVFGYGVRVEDEVSPSGVINVPNPTILLDNGKKVYGCECWWGPEQAVRAWIGDLKVTEVDIEEARARGKE